jgi:rhamnosyltransferase
MYTSIVVTYYPDQDHLRQIVNELLASGLIVVIYDNTPASEKLSQSFYVDSRVHILSNGDNQGLGTAFNESLAFLQGKLPLIQACLFFDQDSFVKQAGVKSLIKELEYLQSKGLPVGVLGACPVDQRGIEYSFRKVRNISPDQLLDRFSSVSFVITSFSIVPFDVFQKVGMFDENLFIDLVDSEFSYRCRVHGLLNLISKKTVFTHVIGESRKTIFGRTFSISSPMRNYYQARNLIIVGRDYGWYWYAFSTVCRRFVQVVLSGFYENDLRIRLKYFFTGIYHGLIYRTGRL